MARSGRPQHSSLQLRYNPSSCVAVLRPHLHLHAVVLRPLGRDPPSTQPRRGPSPPPELIGGKTTLDPPSSTTPTPVVDDCCCYQGASWSGVGGWAVACIYYPAPPPYDRLPLRSSRRRQASLQHGVALLDGVWRPGQSPGSYQDALVNGVVPPISKDTSDVISPFQNQRLRYRCRKQLRAATSPPPTLKLVVDLDEG
jgi:hypothetical protein